MSKLSYQIYLFLILVLPTRALADTAVAAFETASPEYTFSFPRDHGAHFGFQTEWWYLTGHAVLKDQRLFSQPSRFGFQLTFFRRSLAALQTGRFNQYFFAHAGLSDPADAKFLSARRSARSNLGLADASGERLSVFIKDWRLESTDNALELDYSIDRNNSLKLSAILPPPSLQGEAGYSRKGISAGSASQYYSIPRIFLNGTITRAGIEHQVNALGWLDHEFMSNALSSDQLGWDWFSVSLKSGIDLMLFRMRSKTGDDYWSGSIIKDGVVRSLNAAEFTVRQLGSWSSPASGAVYPAGWKLDLPSAAISLQLKPIMADQEQRAQPLAAPVYWEGAVQDIEAEAIGYVELTGYAAEIGAKF